MSADFNAPEGARSPETSSETESPMFAPTPVWARTTKKRRGRGDRSDTGATQAPAQSWSDPALDAGEAGAGAGVLGATTAAEPADADYEIGSTSSPERRGVSAAAIVGGLAALAAIGAVGWYASQPHDRGVAQMTPGAPAASESATSETALNTATPPPVSPAATTPAPADSTTPAATATTTDTHRTVKIARPARATAAAHRQTTVAERAAAPRARPTGDYSAMDTGVNASATAPMVHTPAPAPTPPAAGMNTAPTASNPATVNPAPAVAPTPDVTAPPAVTTTAPSTPAAPAPTTTTP